MKEYFEEGDPRRDDVNRFGFLWECAMHYRRHQNCDFAFADVLCDVLDGEFEAREAGTYPPAGHDFARQENA
jgi:hypothetical protein